MFEYYFTPLFWTDLKLAPNEYHYLACFVVKYFKIVISVFKWFKQYVAVENTKWK